MPRPPRSEPRVVTSLAEAEAVLREAGGRVSTARRAILTVLLDSDGPLSADEVADEATPPLDLAATYRNLEHLERLGLVRHVHLGHGPALYEMVAAHIREYALCESCGTALSFDPAKLDRVRAAIDDAVGIEPHFTHFPMVGLCANCR